MNGVDEGSNHESQSDVNISCVSDFSDFEKYPCNFDLRCYAADQSGVLGVHKCVANIPCGRSDVDCSSELDEVSLGHSHGHELTVGLGCDPPFDQLEVVLTSDDLSGTSVVESVIDVDSSLCCVESSEKDEPCADLEVVPGSALVFQDKLSSTWVDKSQRSVDMLRSRHMHIRRTHARLMQAHTPCEPWKDRLPALVYLNLASNQNIGLEHTIIHHQHLEQPSPNQPELLASSFHTLDSDATQEVSIRDDRPYPCSGTPRPIMDETQLTSIPDLQCLGDTRHRQCEEAQALLGDPPDALISQSAEHAHSTTIMVEPDRSHLQLEEAQAPLGRPPDVPTYQPFSDAHSGTVVVSGLGAHTQPDDIYAPLGRPPDIQPDGIPTVVSSSCTSGDALDHLLRHPPDVPYYQCADVSPSHPSSLKTVRDIDRFISTSTHAASLLVLQELLAFAWLSYFSCPDIGPFFHFAPDIPTPPSTPPYPYCLVPRSVLVS